MIEFENPANKRTTHILVPPNHLWLEGDNAENSNDSRFFGAVSMNLVKDKVIYKVILECICCYKSINRCINIDI